METYIENVKNAIQPSRLSLQSLYPSDWVEWSATKGNRPAVAARRAVETNAVPTSAWSFGSSDCSHLVAARAHQATFIGYDGMTPHGFCCSGPVGLVEQASRERPCQRRPEILYGKQTNKYHIHFYQRFCDLCENPLPFPDEASSPCA